MVCNFLSRSGKYISLNPTTAEAPPSRWLMCAQKPYVQVLPYQTAVGILPGIDFTEKEASAALNPDMVSDSGPC